MLFVFISNVEIRSMERGICPIAVFYSAVNVLSLTFKNVIGQQCTNLTRFWVK